MPTIRCTSCSEWHHRPCVILLDVEPLTFVCERHPHSRGHALSMVGGMDMGAGADMDGTPPNPKFIPNTADDIGIGIGIVNAPVVGVGAGGGGGVSGDVRVFCFCFCPSRISELTCDLLLLYYVVLLWWVVDGKIIVSVGDAFVRDTTRYI